MNIELAQNDFRMTNQTSRAGLLGLATAVPPHVVEQDEVAARARAIFGSRFADFERLVPVFKTAGILKRHMVMPAEWYIEPRAWPDRTEAYLAGAQDLFVTAAEHALDAARCTAAEVDTIVTISSTGIATPSLEARVSRRMGFREDVARVPVFGLGCAGGATGLSLAARLAEARPGTTVLMVAVEICTTAFRMDQLTKANIVATALFGDGAAASVMRAGHEGACHVEGAGEQTWPDTLNIMGWSVDPEGFGVIFDRDIPPFAERHFGPAVDAILGRIGVTRQDVGRYCCHPGGSKVIRALEQTLALDEGALDHERAVLADYGNMSAPTVLFVLDRLLKAGLPSRTVLTALGPGFSASCVSLLRAA